MSRPLFSVGEEVILCSSVDPSYNGGEYTVFKQTLKGEVITCRITGEKFLCPKNDSYLLCSPLLHWTGTECVVREQSLRKKHKPSDESFYEMMKNIKQNNKVTVGADK